MKLVDVLRTSLIALYERGAGTGMDAEGLIALAAGLSENTSLTNLHVGGEFVRVGGCGKVTWFP